MLGLAGILFAVSSSPMGAGRPQVRNNTSANPAPAVQYRTTLNRYCVTCHNDKLKTAGLSLEKIDVENPPAGAEIWEKVIRKVRSNAMPPPGRPQPEKAFYDDFPAYLESSIDRAAFAKLNPGRPVAHRLNRAEYVNSVRDFLSVEIDPEALPSDDTGYGFDNIGDVLSVSPTLLEKYFSAARKVSRLAVGDPAMRPVDEVFELPEDLIQTERMSEDLPLRSRGGTVIRYHFPADGDYIIKVRLLRDGGPTNGDGGTIRGVALKRQLDIRLDKERLKLFVVGGEQFGKSGGDDDEYGGGDPKQVEYETRGADANLEVRVPVTAGPHLVGVAFQTAADTEPEGVIRGRPRRGGKNAEPGVKRITIRGPFNAKSLGETPSRKKIFICRPAEAGSSEGIKLASLNSSTDADSCARNILSSLAHRAYRRPVSENDLQHLLKFYETGKGQGGFEVGIRMALERLLVGPEFLFRIENDPPNAAPGTVFRISDLELASRLSFFLWSSIPDDELLGLAERGRLKDPAVLDQQVRRMLRDPRSKTLATNFAGQWLQIRKLSETQPDISEFPDYDINLKEAFAEETELFLQSLLEENHPLMDLLDADYTFLNERLARHYGVPNVYGSSFRRVTLKDENRRGLLGHGSVLMLTSYPNRTSVVLRGVWLLTNILASPPPPPPPNVPAFKERGDDGTIKTVRESMEEHRANPACAACHMRMDPLGFALENFNAIGQWRTTEGTANTPIDNSGELPDGTKFNGPVELRRVLMSKPDQFATSVIEKLLTYALGRGVEYYDEPVVRKIRRETAPEHRWAALVQAIVKSEPFQMARTREP
jgi:hypothetical protein